MFVSIVYVVEKIWFVRLYGEMRRVTYLCVQAKKMLYLTYLTMPSLGGIRYGVSHAKHMGFGTSCYIEIYIPFILYRQVDNKYLNSWYLLPMIAYYSKLYSDL